MENKGKPLGVKSKLLQRWCGHNVTGTTAFNIKHIFFSPRLNCKDCTNYQKAACAQHIKNNSNLSQQGLLYIFISFNSRNIHIKVNSNNVLKYKNIISIDHKRLVGSSKVCSVFLVSSPVVLKGYNYKYKQWQSFLQLLSGKTGAFMFTFFHNEF